MAAMNPVDLIVVTDATASMDTYLKSLQTSIPDILALSKLSGSFERLGVVAYRDYSDPKDEIVVWSGWNPPDLVGFVTKLEATGGGDYPEAAKSALIHVVREVKKGGERRTLVLWYADAPPHHPFIASYGNANKEKNAFPEGSTDWVKLSFLAKRLNMTVFSFIDNSIETSHASFYVFLSEVTGGLCIKSRPLANAISRLTLETILKWMGQDSKIDTSSGKIKFLRYSSSVLDDRPSNELDGSLGYLPPPRSAKAGSKTTPLRAIRRDNLEASDVPIGPLGSTPLSLPQRFKTEPEYRGLVYSCLTSIIASNVHALTYNAIFGQLWRTVCAQPPSAEQIALLNAFSSKVGSITDPVQKAALQAWLEESYDATEEIDRMVERAEPNGLRVYLDLDAGVDLTRIELLDVSRSCHSGVLKKLTSIFTHLKLVEPDAQLAPNQRTLPLSLRPTDFFRILPHLVVTGTLYPPRAAALTAILALVTGVSFLEEHAKSVLAPLKGKWVDMAIPENISFDCARFLLSAPEGIVLTSEEKKGYQCMHRYKLIELNLESTIVLKVPWTPEKTREVGDYKIKCSKCLISRSVTLMSREQIGICGPCLSFVEQKPSDYPDRGKMNSCWVECAVKSCRAQYIVEDPQRLRVRPKCYYCRANKPCPWVDCTRCANRIIFPECYRNMSTQFLCPGCENPEKKTATIVPRETTPVILNKENGLNWLGLKPCIDFFRGRSAFKLMEAHGTDVFNLTIPTNGSVALTMDGKKVHDSQEAQAQVENWVGAGKIELGSCSLCFDDMQKSKLVAACGRTGCTQRVDHECIREWYAKSEPGKLINLMQLTCPFCRRKPAPQTLARYNPHAIAIGGLQQAMADHRWFYAWCLHCGFAKQAVERVCTEGGLPDIRGFQCVECQAEFTNTSRSRITKCPNCKVPVQKIDGCNHITCLCGTHFCHCCGAGDVSWSAEDCYKHLSANHGGAFGYEELEED